MWARWDAASASINRSGRSTGRLKAGCLMCSACAVGRGGAKLIAKMSTQLLLGKTGAATEAAVVAAEAAAVVGDPAKICERARPANGASGQPRQPISGEQ